MSVSPRRGAHGVRKCWQGAGLNMGGLQRDLGNNSELRLRDEAADWRVVLVQQAIARYHVWGGFGIRLESD